MPKKQTIIGPSLPNIPWEEKPKSCKDVVWRSTLNPIITRDAVPRASTIFNSAVIPYKGAFAGVFRCDSKSYEECLHFGKSKDGFKWDINPEPIKLITGDPDLEQEGTGYDPRVCWLEDRYYITWCNSYYGPTIGVAHTTDFKKYYQLENAFLPFNRNGVLFPRKINNKYAMLSRPSGPGHNTFGNIFYSESPDMNYWGKHRLVMKTKPGWQCAKIGAGPIPIETTEGWLLIYHGVRITCNGFIYCAGAALLDIDKPWKTLYRTGPYIMAPWEIYECAGDVPNVVFPCSTLSDAPTGRIAIYYGAADTTTCLAYTQVDTLIDYIKSNSIK
ncbi:MAG: glycoside hydrolase family 130 protein [Elusimicrobia bacterium]|nr:glycoside hydrolase family 130 protein [Elusimicrobiota bacterium]